MQIKFNFNNPLPEKFEEEMPQDLTAIERYEWREHKLKELQIAGLVQVDDDGNCNFGAISDVKKNIVADNIISNGRIRQSKTNFTKRTPKNEGNIEFVHNIPKSVMESLRRLFPVSASKADLISAAIYILTNGDCQISDKAMELVKQYAANDSLTSVNERLTHLENTAKRQLELLQSIELCTCYNTFDRRYGSNEPRRAPKLTEFREKDNLDMLERLREQARDQFNLDNQTKGRQIYEQIKDKYD